MFSAYGCRGTAPAPSDPPATLEDAASASAFAASDAASAPPPLLSVDNRAPGQFVLRAGAAVQVATKAVIERRADDGRWSAYDDLEGGKGYRLVEGCAEVEPPPCRALRVDDVLVPEPWSGQSCSAQCKTDCDKNVFRAGVHRLIVTTCDTPPRRFEGQPFEVPSSEAMLARQRAASDVVRATIVRLDPHRAKAATGARSDDHRAGFAVVPGTVNAIEVDGRSELVKWLRRKENFKDGNAEMRKVCAEQPAVGFSLTSSSGSDRERVAEVVLEFGCNRITVVHEQGGQRVTTVSFFDPSRSVVVAIASRAVPSDGELGRLQ